MHTTAIKYHLNQIDSPQNFQQRSLAHPQLISYFYNRNRLIGATIHRSQVEQIPEGQRPIFPTV